MNSNAFHNIANGVILVLTALIGFDYTVFGYFGFTPEAAALLVSGLTAAKLVVNALRDGITGMFAEQPPVVK